MAGIQTLCATCPNIMTMLIFDQLLTGVIGFPAIFAQLLYTACISIKTTD